MTSLIYLQIGFWRKLESDTSVEGVRTLLNVYDALMASNVVTDMTEEDLTDDKYLMMWFKHSLTHKEEIKLCEAKEFENMFDGIDKYSSSEDLSATYMLDKSTMLCDGYSSQYGICVVSADGLPQKTFLFKGDGFSLEKREKHNERYKDFRGHLQYPCNSMIVIDPYLLTEKSNIERNLINLLDTTLPLRLKVSFNLSIISILGNPDRNIKYNPYEIGKEIEDNILRIRPNLEYTLGILYILRGGAFHRRLVLTNNWIADFADGINLFNSENKSEKNTTIDIVFPRLIGNERQDATKYKQWIYIAKKQFSDAPAIMRYGTSSNRLFELV